MLKHNYFSYGLFSLLLHGLVVLAILLSINWQTVFKPIESGKALKTYLYSFKSFSQQSDGSSRLLPATYHQSDKPGHKALSHRSVTYDTLSNSQLHRVATQNSKLIKTDAELIEILHAHIQQDQYYPRIALLLKQKGMVRISFRLYPNGNMDDIRISKSSGISNLDQAALTTIRAILPVKEAKSYLSSARNFFIDLHYG